ncbi:hypothetical protein CV102_23735 [Natronococcus pandeyae]|uniref:Uncharacterized protein n=1 Tax=Natronococcus pandeyae TaxID=2055836 RepID=A0A8J8TPX6_9EURY|nr:hypothetical protein [Natronococcus pandeyae]TYL36159.1 hypothetical protein CV102_23735 [Natronococcus pandeyae]
MRYITHTLKIVTGIPLSYWMYSTATDPEVYGGVIFIIGILFFAGLFLTVHGLFTGMETVLATVDEQSSEK